MTDAQLPNRKQYVSGGRIPRQRRPLLPTEGVDLINRIRQKVTYAENGCWLWNGQINEKGYGKICLTEKDKPKHYRYVHRMVAQVTYGPLAYGMLVLRRCGMPSCCNPKHLYIGTRLDKSSQAISKQIKVTAGYDREHMRTVLREQLLDAVYDELTEGSFTLEACVVNLLDEIISLRKQLDAITHD